MPSDRPPIPNELRRAVLVEAGHRCAIPTCRQYPVEVDHIVDWAKTRRHDFDNLIALCPTCHARKTKGEIDTLAMKQYKLNLGVSVNRPWPRTDPQAPSEVGTSGIGEPLDRMNDPIALEVQPSIAVSAVSGLPSLPQYVRRPLDEGLGERVGRVLEGASEIVILVGGSSTGKTRALFEALAPLRKAKGWRLWHPRMPTRRSALSDLDKVGPRTVVWLNETQEYLRTSSSSDKRERAVTALRSLLTNPERAPVLIVGTLWDSHYDDLRNSVESQAKSLLESAVIQVPDAFAGPDLDAAQRAAYCDPRWEMALEHADDGQLTQYLAAGPELVARYEFCPSLAAKAIMKAAMDARRLGHGRELRQRFLEASAYAYMSTRDRDSLPRDWLELAVAEIGRECRGARGPVTWVKPPPWPSRTDQDTTESSYPRDSTTGSGPLYQLADFLEQYGQTERAGIIPPVRFWEAAAMHTHPRDMRVLAEAAWARGLYRDAVQLWKNATFRGDVQSGGPLIGALDEIQNLDDETASWIVEHVALSDGWGLAGLLDALLRLGMDTHLELLARRVAAEVAVDNSYDVARLLRILWQSGSTEPLGVLATRAADGVALDDETGMADLLETLHMAGLTEQLTVFAFRIANEAAVNEAERVSLLLETLLEAQELSALVVLAFRIATDARVDNAEEVAGFLQSISIAASAIPELFEAADLLADRAVRTVNIDDPETVAGLLYELWDADLAQRFRVLVDRLASDCTIDVADYVLTLLGSWWDTCGLHDTEFTRQFGALAARAARNVCINNTEDVDHFLYVLWEAGLTEQFGILADRIASGLDVRDALRMSDLLSTLRRAKYTELADVIASRAATDSDLNCPASTALLLVELVGARLVEQAEILANRAASLPLDGACKLEGKVEPDHVAFLLKELINAGFDEQGGVLGTRAAVDCVLNSPPAVSELFQVMSEAGQLEQSHVLATRAATELILDDANTYSTVTNVAGIARLLEELTKAEFNEAADLLATRAATDAILDCDHGTAEVLRVMRNAGLVQQARALATRTASDIVISDAGVAKLIQELRAAGLTDQLSVLVGRLPAEGRFRHFCRETRHPSRFRFGREPDGTPAAAWTWRDIT
ncbi:HNH endonuclease [Nocardia suismassiliense]|uniref:HNH endonuclease n=1 Tax=Nocardia suismassiliense TaxID=2077092 RepID=A0ABW6R6H0_9NOCA